MQDFLTVCWTLKKKTQEASEVRQPGGPAHSTHGRESTDTCRLDGKTVEALKCSEVAEDAPTSDYNG